MVSVAENRLPGGAVPLTIKVSERGIYWFNHGFQKTIPDISRGSVLVQSARPLGYRQVDHHIEKLTIGFNKAA